MYNDDGLSWTEELYSEEKSISPNVSIADFANPLSTSREWDGESVNYYYRARYYNPYVGRFT
ncbi:MAG: hypothetical protein QME16_05510, partial [Planctomycetota bacterium]|nr:hypothetical protein [Planctomycetota bacterium]